MNEEYKKFVASLMKPGHLLAKEISDKEEEMVDSCFNICFIASSLKYQLYDLSVFTMIERQHRLSLKHMMMGILGEAAELIDPIKRVTIYRVLLTGVNKEGDTYINNIKEEIGDLLFYCCGFIVVINEIQNHGYDFEEDEWDDIAILINEVELIIESIKEFINSINKYISSQFSSYNLSYEECLENNQKKLKIRYEKGSYSDKQATERADKEDIDKLALIIKRKLDENYPTCGDGVWGLPYIKDVMQGKKINNNDEKVLSFYNNLK